MKTKFVLFLASAALLASCGGNSSSHATGLASSEPHATGLASSSAVASATYLDWVADNKIVIDLFDAGDARFTYGNAALSAASNTLDLNASAALACSSTFTAETLINFVYIAETPSETGINAGVALYMAIEGDKVADFLENSEEYKGKTRAYVAISFGSTVQWAKNKNAAMDAKIQQLIDAAK